MATAAKPAPKRPPRTSGAEVCIAAPGEEVVVTEMPEAEPLRVLVLTWLMTEVTPWLTVVSRLVKTLTAPAVAVLRTDPPPDVMTVAKLVPTDAAPAVAVLITDPPPDVMTVARLVPTDAAPAVAVLKTDPAPEVTVVAAPPTALVASLNTLAAPPVATEMMLSIWPATSTGATRTRSCLICILAVGRSEDNRRMFVVMRPSGNEGAVFGG